MKRAMKRLGLVLCAGVAGCFPPPHLKDAAGATAGGDTSEATDTGVSGGDVPAQCSGDEQCGGLAVAPCVVGRCEAGKCVGAQIAVTCDDGDPCTTADRCAAGVCKGRAFTAEEAKNWSLVLSATGENSFVYLSDLVVHPSGEMSTVGILRGTVDFGTIGIRDEPGQAAYYLRLDAGGTVKQATRLFDATRVDALPHTVLAFGEDALVVSAQYDGNSAGPNASTLQVATKSGGVEAPTPSIPGTIFRAVAVDDKLLVMGEFSSDVSFSPTGSDTVHFHPSGTNDLYIAQLSRSGVVAWVKGWASTGADLGGALTTTGTDLLFTATTELSEGGAVAANFDGIPLTKDEMAATFRIPSNGGRSSHSTVPNMPRALLLGGFATASGDVIGTTLEAPPGTDWTQPASNLSFTLQRFFPGGAQPRWSVGFSGAFVGTPIPMELANHDVLLLWNVGSPGTISGWPTAVPSAPAILFGVWSSDGHLRSSWTLPGFRSHGVPPKELMNFFIAREAASPAPDGSLVVSGISNGASLGPDFGDASTTAQGSVILRYSPAHIFGCAVLR